MLKQRTFTAIVLLVLAYIWFFCTSFAIFVLIAWLICALILYELTMMYNFSAANQFLLLMTLAILAFGLHFNGYRGGYIIKIMVIAIWCFLVPMILIWQPKEFSKLVVAILGLVLFVPGFYALIMLHKMLGVWAMVSIMAIAWVADTSAYFFGRMLGRHKLAVNISPGKSIEGAIGGLVVVTAYLLILKYFHLAIFLYGYGALFKFALVLTVASVIGDLFESWLKRVANVKDSGNILPGHGGLFDRVDSLVAVLSVSFAMLYGDKIICKMW